MAVSAILHANEAKGSMKQFQCIKIQSKTIDLSTRLGGITTEFVGFCSLESFVEVYCFRLKFNISKLVCFVLTLSPRLHKFLNKRTF